MKGMGLLPSYNIAYDMGRESTRRPPLLLYHNLFFDFEVELLQLSQGSQDDLGQHGNAGDPSAGIKIAFRIAG